MALPAMQNGIVRGMGASMPGQPTGQVNALNKPTAYQGSAMMDPNAAAQPQQQNPAGIQADPSIINSMQNFANAAYNNQVARLDPQWQQQKNAFDQQMVSQGIQPGSEAYNNAFQNFSMARNDAYSQAYNNSFTTGLAAQNQAFNQAALPAQLQNAYNIANLQADAQLGSAAQGANASMFDATTGANASMHNADASNATNQLLGLGNLGLGYGNLQNQTNQQNFQDYMSMLGYGNSLDQYNNGLVGGAQNTLMGLIPNGNPSMVDVTGAYGLNQAGQNAAYQGQVANSNAQNQMYGSALQAAMMFAMMSSKELKDDHGPAEKTLEAVRKLPVHKWNYKNDPIPHIGTFAEDFNEALGLDKKPFINFIDMFGALTGSVQAIANQLDRIEQRLTALEAA